MIPTFELTTVDDVLYTDMRLSEIGNDSDETTIRVLVAVDETGRIIVPWHAIVRLEQTD